MRTLRLEALALATLLAGLTLASGQQPTTPETTKPKEPASPDKQPPRTLEQLLEQALQHNPDIRIAEAEVQSKEAELNKTRLGVMQKVISAHHSLTLAQANVRAAEAQLARYTRNPGAASQEDIAAAQARLVAAKAELAQVESQLHYLIGQPALHAAHVWNAETGEAAVSRAEKLGYAASIARAQDAWNRYQVPSQKPGPMADKIRAALDTPVTLDGDATLGEVLHLLTKKFPELTFLARGDNQKLYDMPIRPQFKNVPLGAVLQWIEDSASGNNRFVVRDYGLLLAPVKDLPPGALYLTDFWKGGEKAEGKKPEGER